MSLEEFVADRKTRLAVEKLFEIIGEAAYKIDKSYKADHPEIEWSAIEGTRHIKVHNYYAVVPEILWNAKENHFEELKEKVELMYNQLESEK